MIGDNGRNSETGKITGTVEERLVNGESEVLEGEGNGEVVVEEAGTRGSRASVRRLTAVRVGKVDV